MTRTFIIEFSCSLSLRRRKKKEWKKSPVPKRMKELFSFSIKYFSFRKGIYCGYRKADTHIHTLMQREILFYFHAKIAMWLQPFLVSRNRSWYMKVIIFSFLFFHSFFFVFILNFIFFFLFLTTNIHPHTHNPWQKKMRKMLDHSILAFHTTFVYLCLFRA